MEIVDKNFVKFNSPLFFNFESYVIDQKSINGNKKIKNFFDELKNIIVKNIFYLSKEIYGFQKSKIVFNEFYCNPYNENINTLRIKIDPDLSKDISISGEIHVLGIWISEKSFGPYIVLYNYEIIKNNNKFIIVNSEHNSDDEFDNSDDEIESIIKNKLK
jgi:hypothetical protein